MVVSEIFVEHSLYPNDIEKCNVLCITHNYPDQLPKVHILHLKGKSIVYTMLKLPLLLRTIQFPSHELLMADVCKIFITNALKIVYKPI